MFVDLRDHYGLTQLVLHPETPGFALVERLRAESVIRIDGEVVARAPEVVNPGLPTRNKGWPRRLIPAANGSLKGPVRAATPGPASVRSIRARR